MLRTITTVLSAFIGIRRKADHEASQAKLSPVQIIVTAIVLALLMIVGLIFLVKLIASQAAA